MRVSYCLNASSAQWTQTCTPIFFGGVITFVPPASPGFLFRNGLALRKASPGPPKEILRFRVQLGAYIRLATTRLSEEDGGWWAG